MFFFSKIRRMLLAVPLMVIGDSAGSYPDRFLIVDQQEYSQDLAGWYCLGWETANAALVVREQQGEMVGLSFLEEQHRWNICFPGRLEIKDRVYQRIYSVIFPKPASGAANYPLRWYFVPN